MRARGAVAVGLGALLLAIPAPAFAGTVTRNVDAIEYQADGSLAEGVLVGGDNMGAFVSSELGATSVGDCTQTSTTRVDCPATPAFIVRLSGVSDSASGEQVTGAATLRAFGGAGDDSLTGTRNADRLLGEDGGDTLDGAGGDDVLDGGPGDDSLSDGEGNDTVAGGPGNDIWNAGPGADTFTGGDASDSVAYRARTANVTITLDGRADDGEAGEGDNVGADVEELAGGSGHDRIAAGANGSRLLGGAGNDFITGSPNEDRVEGEEGDDTIDTRDGRFDSVDCGPGNDTLLADPGDFATNCEIAPDRDGDGTLNEADCAPDNAAVHPGAGEIVGNDVDEDCKGGPGYLRVEAGVSFRFVPGRHPPRIRFATLRVTALKAGDRVVLRCRRSSRCPFRTKAVKVKAGKRRINLLPRFKQRFLPRGTVVEIRILRERFEGKIFRLRVLRGPDVRQTRLCLKPGETRPRTC